jgi:hypothetical protein
VSPNIRKQLIAILLITAIIGIIYFLSKPVSIPHSISGKGIVYPVREWTLARNSDGNILMSLKNNITNSISNYSVTEFQRGDLAEFIIKSDLFGKDYVKAGDTIGLILSNTEQRKLIEHYGELEIQQRLLEFYATGEKQEYVQASYERMMLALQEYETQKRITERNQSLFERNYIAEEEYEISLNQYLVKFQNYNIAKSEYQVATTGSKPEQLNYILARINSIKEQITHLEQLISSFNITTPISGRIVKQQGVVADYDIIVKIADTTKYMLVTPIDLYHLEYISIGQNLTLSHPAIKNEISASINGFDNKVQFLNQRQKIFVHALLDSTFTHIYPGMQLDVKINSGPVSLKEYAIRFYNEVYNN